MSEKDVRIIFTALDKTRAAVNSIKGAFKDLEGSAKSFRLQMSDLDNLMAQGAGIGMLYGMIRGLKQTIDTAEQTQNALRGLASIARYAGEDIGKSMDAAMRLSVDGLIDIQSAATSLKNLLSRGFTLDESIKLLERFKDSAAFGRQASLSMSEAVKSATEGLKNENSILVDNAGVTKNVSVMWAEYARSIGKGVSSLSQAEKRTAEYNGILLETEGLIGNAKLAIEGITGAKAELRNEIFKLSNSIGTTFTPVFIGLAKAVVWTLENAIKPFIGGVEMMGAKFGNVVAKIGANIAWMLGGFTGGFSAIKAEFEALDNLLDQQLVEIAKKYDSAILGIPEIGKDTGARRKDVIIPPKVDTAKQTREAADAHRKALEFANAQIEAELARSNDVIATEMAKLEAIYSQGQLAITDYFAQRRDMAEQGYQAEKKAIEESLALAEDEASKTQLRVKLIELEGQKKRDIIGILNEETEANKRLKDARQELHDLSDETDFRAAQTKFSDDFISAQQKELTELEYRHQKEIEALQNKTVALELETQKQQEIKDLAAAQDMERAALIVQQEKNLLEFKAETARESAGIIGDIFNNLYAATNEKVKAFFFLSRAAAIAEAIINAELAATKAIGQMGVFGIPMSALLRAQGYAAAAAIAAQTIAGYALGGEIKGTSSSSTADDIPIKATAGEYMQPVSSVRHYGLGVMEAIRQRMIPKELFSGFNLPGTVRSPAGMYAGGGVVAAGAGATSYAISVPINIGDANQGLAGALRDGIEKTVISIMEREMA